MTIQQWLKQATDELADAMFISPLLDAEIILAHTIRKPRTHLHAHGEDELDARQEDVANARIELRKDHVPIAYIIGHRYFYGRRFSVSPAVLIPRPESEQLIETLKTLLAGTLLSHKRLVDIGTGSGCLGVTAKLEFPELDVALLDTSQHALTVAEKNANAYSAEVELIKSDLLTNYPYSPDIVLANLPYVDETWEQSPELYHEPSEALFAKDNGLAIIKRCIEQCSRRLSPGALLLLEADTRQLDALATIASTLGFSEVARDSFTIAFKLG
jgi:release factor glutamine methyltransferase